MKARINGIENKIKYKNLTINNNQINFEIDTEYHELIENIIRKIANNFDFEEIGTPLSFKWGKCKLATSSYGHGITTTPLQLARAYAILGNGGYKIQPNILKIKKESLKRNIDPKITKRIWKNMIWSYIDFEKRNFKKK